jgi:hypothetical protein
VFSNFNAIDAQAKHGITCDEDGKIIIRTAPRNTSAPQWLAILSRTITGVMI